MKAMNAAQIVSFSISMIAVALTCLSVPVRGVTALDAANAFNSYNAAYLVNSGGQAYYKHSLDDAVTDTDWVEAISIEGAEDAYEVTGTAANQTLVNNLCSTFVTNNPNPWSWDGWNDNLGWDALAVIRGYQMTGNTALLTYAENTFNQCFSRGWDTTSNGGGIWEEQPANGGTDKEALSNDSNCQVALMIYQSTGTTTYLTEAEQIYNWMLANLYNSSSGQVYTGITPSGTVNTSTSLYNQGTFIDVSVLLYQITGTTSYLTNAQNAVTYAQNHLMVNGICSNQASYLNTWAAEFSRGLGHLVKWDPALLPTYSSFLQKNATAAWNCRRTDYNVSWNAWTVTTPPNLNITANWDVNLVAIMEWANPLPANTYAILNQNSGMSLEPYNGGTTSQTTLAQATYTGSTSELWNVSLFGPGEFSAIGVQSGLAACVTGNSTANNASLELLAYNGASDELYTPVNQGGNLYNLDFTNSNLAMSVQNASTTSGAAVVQNPPSSAANEEWSFQPVLTTGNYVLFVNSTGMCLSTQNGNTASETPLVQTPYTASADQVWTVTSLGGGQYDCIGAQSGLSINVVAGSTNSGAALQIYPWQNTYNERITLADASGGAGYDNIIFVNSGLAMSVQNASTTAGAPLVQYAASTAPSEQWFFQPAAPVLTSGTYSLAVNSTGMSMATSGGATTAGTALVQSPFDGESDELWNVTALGGGQYSAIGAESGLAMCVPGSSTTVNTVLELEPYVAGTTGEEFTLQYSKEGGGTYNVIMVNSGMALAIYNNSTTSGANIVQNTLTNYATNEQWTFQPSAPIPTGTYSLVVNSTAMCLTTQNGATASGTFLVQAPPNGTTDDLWNVTSLGNGQYSAIGVQSGLSINVSGNSNANNAQLLLYTYTGANNELFTLQATPTAGYYNVVMVNSGLAMAVQGASTASGADIVQSTLSTGTNELWQFQPQTPTIASGTYAMLVQSTGMGLTANTNNTKDTDLFQSHFDDWHTNQQWTVTSLGNGEYSAIGVASGLSINVQAASVSNNANMILFPYNGQSNELFTLVSQGGGYYNIDMVNSGLALAIYNASTTSGANVVQYTPSTASDELWSFQLIAAGLDGGY